MGIPERIDVIIAELGISERELARRAGLADSHIGLLKDRLRDDPGAVTLNTLEAIAKAGNVSVAWLIGAAGDPRAAGVGPNKTAAAELARAEGVWERAIQSVLAAPTDAETEGKPAAWWLLRMKMEELNLLEEADRWRAAKRATPTPPAVEPTGATPAKRSARAKRGAR